MSPILCISDFELQRKHLEKFKSNRATKNRRRKSKVFCMYGTVASKRFKDKIKNMILQNITSQMKLKHRFISILMLVS